ncbi:MAG: DUF4112 domain-containing protein [Chitinophagales bacterium]|nr:DUF4112 domain-containing protein [Chitinophagales bacterium]
MSNDIQHINQDSSKKLPVQLQQLEKLVNLMDNAFTIPGTKYKIGLDPIINLIPGLGWVVDFFISFYLFLAMYKNGSAQKNIVFKMFSNIILDSLVGAIPIIGTVFDFAFKANRRNYKLAIEHFEDGKHSGSIWIILIPMLVFLFLFFAAMLYFIFYLFKTLNQITI